MEDVRVTSAWVASRSSHVKVDSQAIEEFMDKIHGSVPKIEWNFEGIHYFDNGPLTVQYLLVLDALNFCFWPDKDLFYDHLAFGLKQALENDKSALDADRLQRYTGPQLREMLKWQKPLPLEDERIRLLHEVGSELEKSFDGKATNLVKACGNSALSLVTIVAKHFPVSFPQQGFRDHSLYRGHQIFFYKRAQIFVADLWNAFKGKGYGSFHDISSVTIFADYIVPAVLRQLGILKYSSSLSSSIDTKKEIVSGSEEEVEIRACSIYAVEKMRELIQSKYGMKFSRLTAPSIISHTYNAFQVQNHLLTCIAGLSSKRESDKLARPHRFAGSRPSCGAEKWTGRGEPEPPTPLPSSLELSPTSNYTPWLTNPSSQLSNPSSSTLICTPYRPLQAHQPSCSSSSQIPSPSISGFRAERGG
ncbi:hypothetical protein AXF42_Ash015946 [Apostasia shenzhenica]|uniref:Queuosine 5'-phosphate N-glycosylase/hydrolase n=1 Tax=Apostasia shenzhenica TaxID=1088818 RepID=A0A2I0AWH0_9ASPA|nr:hypothetical protein AXF42_Ash015946 [Apostasia shenzhenica]